MGSRATIRTGMWTTWRASRTSVRSLLPLRTIPRTPITNRSRRISRYCEKCGMRAGSHFGSRPDRHRNEARIGARIPARNEAAVIDQAIASLLTQELVSPICINVVGHGNTDGTSEVVQRAASSARRAEQVTVISGL